jgi:hypothetical protein
MALSPSATGPRSIKYADRMHAQYFTLMGRAADAEPYLERLRADTAAGRVSPVSLAFFYATTGRSELALPLLRKAVDIKDQQIRFLRVYPQFSGLHGNPEFEELLKRVGV